MIAVVIRAVTYSTLFIGLFLIYVPGQLIPDSWDVSRPSMGAQQIVGLFVGTAGGILALSCVFTFAFLGKGTPAPFDPPRQLVIKGPYRFVRNPMYLGAGLALGGASLFYGSTSLAVYMIIFLLVTHLVVKYYEEPVLRRTFGAAYEGYCKLTRRWWPVRKA